MEPKRDLGMDAALRVARVIHCDLVFAQASAWQWWMAAAEADYKDALIYTDYRQPGDSQTIYPSKILWVLGNYSRFIRPGMVRVEVSGSQNIHGLLASAYFDQKSGGVVAVLINCATNAQNIYLKFSPHSAAPKQFTPWLTSTIKDLCAGEKFNANNNILIPPQSVLTLVGN